MKICPRNKDPIPLVLRCVMGSASAAYRDLDRTVEEQVFAHGGDSQNAKQEIPS
jgi:hypothetical protein